MAEEHEDVEEARRLLAPLAEHPADPSTVDIRRAIADGRRRGRTRRVAGIGAAAAATVLVAAGVPVALEVAGRGPADEPPPAAATGSPSPSPTPSPVPPGPTQCVVERLPVPGDPYQSLVSGGDPTGRYLFGRTYTSSSPDDSNIIPGHRVEPVIWDDGEPTPVEIPGYDGGFTSINSGGVATATSFPSYDGGEPPTGWVYRDGELTALPGGAVAAASSRLRINEQGMIAGALAEPGADAGDGRLTPVVWWSPDDEPEELSVPGPTWSVTASGVDAGGTVVGGGFDEDARPDAPHHSFVWLPDGTRQELPLPTIDGETASWFRADSIVDGVVTGEAGFDRDDGTPSGRSGGSGRPLVRYDLHAGEFTDVSEEPPFHPQAWRAPGWAAGRNLHGLWLFGPARQLVPLPDRLPDVDDPGAPEESTVVVASISEDGRVLGGQMYSGREIEADGGEPMPVDDAVVWHCE